MADKEKELNEEELEDVNGAINVSTNCSQYHDQKSCDKSISCKWNVNVCQDSKFFIIMKDSHA